MQNKSITADFSDVRGRRILLALSGGADSIALLLLLCEQREAQKIELMAAHVDHGIRGEASAQDAVFCEEICKTLHVPFYGMTVDVITECKITGRGMETVARELRYHALRTIAKEHACDYIALAHHKDDLAETVMMHILRGAGLNGLIGMQRFSNDLYRPLLSIPKSALEEYVRGKNIEWRVDSTNAISDNPRNALRLDVFPQIKTYYPGFEDALYRLSETAACDEAFLQKLTRDTVSKNCEFGAYGMLVRHIENVDEPILRRVLSSACNNTISHDALIRAIRFVKDGQGSFELSEGYSLYRTGEKLYILNSRKQTKQEWSLGKGTLQITPLGGSLMVEDCTPRVLKGNPHEQILNAEALKDCVIRTRRAGDRVRPLGCGDKLLSDVFTDKKIDRPLRDFVPLLAKGNRVYWAVGVCISEEAKITKETKQAFHLLWKPENNKTI